MNKIEMHKSIEKFNCFNAKDLIGLYDLIESVCGETNAQKYYNACRRRGIDSIQQLCKLFDKQTDEKTIRLFFQGSYCGERGIAILKECVDWYIDNIPF